MLRITLLFTLHRIPSHIITYTVAYYLNISILKLTYKTNNIIKVIPPRYLVTILHIIVLIETYMYYWFCRVPTQSIFKNSFTHTHSHIH